MWLVNWRQRFASGYSTVDDAAVEVKAVLCGTAGTALEDMIEPQTRTPPIQKVFISSLIGKRMQEQNCHEGVKL